jgi:glycosyltransferase involved in cell wall biosynthesis
MDGAGRQRGQCTAVTSDDSADGTFDHPAIERVDSSEEESSASEGIIPMRILLVNNFYQQNSGENLGVRGELAQLVANGHSVETFFAHNNTIKSPLDKFRAFLSTAYNPVVRDDLIRVMERFKPDIMHVHNFFPLLSPSVFDASHAAGVPSVFTLANFRILCPTACLFHDGRICERSLHQSSWWTVPKRTYKNSYFGTLALAHMVETHKRRGTWRHKVDRFLVPTRFAKAKFVEAGLPAERIVVRPHGLPQSVAAVAEGPRAGALFVGRLTEEKGIVPLVALWRDLGVPLTIVGDGPLRPMLQAMAGPDVRFLGYVDAERKFAEMRRAAFLVVPTVWNEMFGMTVIEAYASGLPVLASRLGGPAETVLDGVTGFLFDHSNPQDVVDTIRRAAATPEALCEMGRAARALYERDYTPEANYANLMRVYQDVLGGQAVSAHVVGC